MRMMGDANIDDALARSQRTLPADQIPEAIGEGAIGFLQGFGRRLGVRRSVKNLVLDNYHTAQLGYALGEQPYSTLEFLSEL